MEELVAKRTLYVLDDDLDGSHADETVPFEWDGIAYTIDLSKLNAAALREALDPFVRAANRTRRVNNPNRRRPNAVHSRTSNAAIRAWARSAGHAVGELGRISDTVVEEYHRVMARSGE
jgi:hypothetical protein